MFSPCKMLRYCITLLSRFERNDQEMFRPAVNNLLPFVGGLLIVQLPDGFKRIVVLGWQWHLLIPWCLLAAIQFQRPANLPGMFSLVLKKAAKHLAGRPRFFRMLRPLFGIENLRPFCLGELAQPGKGRASLHLQEIHDEHALVVFPFGRQGFRRHDA